jgi:hypothetical protein
VEHLPTGTGWVLLAGEVGPAVPSAAVAAFRPNDDVVARGRKIGRLGSKMIKAQETTPVSVPIEFSD